MRRLIYVVILAILLGSSVPFIEAQDNLPTPYIVINVEALNLRSGPGAYYTSYGLLYGGESYQVLGISPDYIWFYIGGTPYGAGWVRGRHTIFRGDINSIVVNNGPYGEFISSTFLVYINIPVYDEVNGRQLGTLRGNTEYAVTGRNAAGSWVRIHTSQFGEVWTQSARGSFRGVWDSVLIVDEITPDEIDPDLPYLVVNVENLNIRTGPDARYESLGVLHGGESYAVTGISPDRIWFYIEDTPFGDGWVRGRFTIFRGNVRAISVTNPPYGVLLTPTFYVHIFIPVYDRPSGRQLGLLPGQREYVITGRNLNGTWVRLETAQFGLVWAQISRGSFRGVLFDVAVIQ